jgi:uncharacterized protein YecT (DUF1311 family)
MWKIISIVFALVVLNPVVGFAATRPDRPFSKQYQACDKKNPNGVTTLMRDCLGDEIGRQDAELNKVYKALMAKLKPANKAILLKSERAWIAYRDTTCDFEGSVEAGGSLEFVIADECLVRQTIYRLEDLKQRLEIVKQSPDDDE